jgi:choline-sulfatase
MGRQYLHTPAMDSLAKRGTVFTRAYAPNPLCMPARSSIFTGRYPHETGVTRNAKPPGGQLDAQFTCMGTCLREAGYTTAYSGKWHLCWPEKEPATHGFQILDSKRKVSPPEEDNYDSRVARAAVEFLSRSPDQPFLLVASFLNPHNICEWARRAAGRTQNLNCGEIGTPPDVNQLPPAPANLEMPQNEPDGMLLMRRAYQVDDGLFPVSRFTAEDWRKQRWGYYRMVEKVDGQIAKVLDALREAGVEQNTLVIFTSDHGDCVGAHRFNQKTVFYDESARIPLIVRWPGQTQPAESDRLVNTGIDLLPTMCDAAGVDQPPHLPGRSLLPLALGQQVPSWREYVVCQNDLAQSGEVDGSRPTMQGRMVRTDRYKYCIYERGVRREALYDLQADPLETVNLAGEPQYRPVLLEHRAHLAEFALRHHDALAADLLADDVAPRPFVRDGSREASQ